MKPRLLIALTLALFLAAPSVALAAACCLNTNYNSCGYKKAPCTGEGVKEVECGAVAACHWLLPACCVYKFPEGNKVPFYCYENLDPNYDCTKSQPGTTTLNKVDSFCADVADCKTGYVDAPTLTPEGTSPTVETETPFKPIAPKLSVTIPTLDLQKFANVTSDGNYYYIPFISVYLSAAFRLGIGIAGVLAIIMIMAGGLIWVASAGDSGKIGQAKTMISNAVVGLVLTVCAYVLLQVVNPDLINLKALQVKIVKPEVADLTAPQPSDIIDPGQYSGAKPSWDAVSYICPPNKTLQPPAGVADPAAMVKLDCQVGVALESSDSGKGMALPAVRDALCKAGEAADKAGENGYVIHVSSSYRPFDVQASLWCSHVTDIPDVNKRRALYAVPGYSNHGKGNAIDVTLYDKKTGKQLTFIRSTTQCNTSPELVKTLEDIMDAAGFVRFNNEIWHFEVGTGGQSSRCSPCGLPASCNKPS